ncbi:MAG: JAB domain-containing protein [Chloroflexota bacterium]
MMVRVRLVRGRRRAPRMITGPADVIALLGRDARNLDREHFWAIALDACNMFLDLELVSIGSLTAAIVHPREVFKAALLANAASILVVHNHPSGDLRASPEDRETTARLKKAGDILGVPLVDHVVLGQGGGFFSFREAGLL